jgi:cell division protein FtsL
LDFIDIQKQEMALDQYEVEWGQMQLELTMLAEQNRVELVARGQLKLFMPPREKIIYIKP